MPRDRAVPSTSSCNSVSGISISEKPQFRQTRSCGNTQTEGLLKFFSPGKWMLISAGKADRFSDPQDLHLMFSSWDRRKQTPTHFESATLVTAVILHYACHACYPLSKTS